MTIKGSGPLGADEIAAEYGGGRPIDLSNYYANGQLVPAGARGLSGAIPSSGALPLSSFYGSPIFGTDPGDYSGDYYTDILYADNHHIQGYPTFNPVFVCNKTDVAFGEIFTFTIQGGPPNSVVKVGETDIQNVQLDFNGFGQISFTLNTVGVHTFNAEFDVMYKYLDDVYLMTALVTAGDSTNDYCYKTYCNNQYIATLLD